MNGPPMPALGVVISGPHYHQYGGGGAPQTISPAGVIDLAGEDFEPQPRDRCNTWPLQKPSGDLSHHTSPLIHEEIPEEELCGDEEEDAGSADNLSDSVPFCGTANRNHLNGGGGDVTGGAFNAADMLLEDLNSGVYDNSSIEDNGFSSGSVAGNSAANAGGSKKNSARRNAWGNLSYADLITQAILHSNEKRLTLSQIYDWMVQNVPYFRDKGDSNSSAGWKNSIRHNLSLHSRFMRIQNEGAGKSSWWIINPEAKPGKSSRRRAGSMEQGAKNLDKKRGRVKKKLDQLRSSTGHLVAGDGSVGELLLSPEPSSAEIVYDGASTAAQQPPATGFSVFGLSPGEFRQRSDSNLSNYSVNSQRGGTTAKLASPLLDDNGGAYDDWAAQAPSGCLGNDYPEDLESMTLNDQQYQLVRDNANNVVMCPQPPSYSTYLAESQQQSTGVAAVNSQQFNNSQQLLGRRQTSPVDVSPRRLMTIGGGGGSGSTTPVKSPQRYSPAAAGGCLNVKKEPPTFSLSSNNPVAELLGSGFAQQQVKTEPPAYQELYPQGRSSLAASNPMLRDVLQKSIGAPLLLGHNFNQHQQDGSFRQSRSDSNFANLIAQQQQQPHPPIDYFGSGNFYPQQHQHAAAAFRPANHHHGNNHPTHHNFQQHNHHHHHTLPTELSDIRYDNHFTSDIQCDIDQVIRHELNVAGKLDFSDFGNIQ